MCVAADAISANIIHANIPEANGCVTEQTSRELFDILLPMYTKFVNPDLWYHQAGRNNIVWKLTGAVTRLRSRQAKNRRQAPPFRGPSCERPVQHDEACIDQDPIDDERDSFLISMAMLRGGDTPSRTLRLTTTPRKNFIYHHLNRFKIADGTGDIRRSPDGTAVAYYAKTIDTDRQLYDRLSRNYSKDLVEQELCAQWLDAKGLIWDNFSFAGDDAPGLLWPKSNIHAHKGINPGFDTILGVDLGAAESAFVVYQAVPAGREFPGACLVAVAEWTPSGARLIDILREIKDYLGGVMPAQIWVGHDINTRGGIESTTAYQAFYNIGWGDAIRTHTGSYTFNKPNQHLITSAAICNVAGERRFAISRNLESFHENDRGLRQMLKRDTWPDKGTEFFRKNKTECSPNDEDIRDAMLYPVSGGFAGTFDAYDPGKLPR
jgi:hypothetical protein